MRFYVSTAFLQADEIVEIARAADELGYEGVAIPDHVVNLETLATPYPYTPDGERRWQPFTDWLDPWVLVGALAQVTTRLKFVTTVYIPAMRDPYSAAKAIGTAAVLSGGRVELGIGVGWCEEEFDLLGQPFARRGKRTDEMLQLMKALWQPGWTEFDGEFYQTPRLEMTPTPPPIPVYGGGLSDIALRRAARNDGWMHGGGTEDLDELLAKLNRYRQEEGTADKEFQIHVISLDAYTPDGIKRLEDKGVTDVIVGFRLPYINGPDTEPLDTKIRNLEMFAENVIAKVN